MNMIVDVVRCDTHKYCISGLADPGPIASMFWLDDGLGSDIYLDGIVTLVDAKHIRQVSYYPSQSRRCNTNLKLC
jgi:G3E family GTPase